MEVECRLEGGVAAYLAGEEVRATVVFSLPPTADWEVRTDRYLEEYLQSSKLVQVGLAWATVQLHCFCTVNHTKVAIPGAGPDTRGGAEGLITRKNSATSYQPTAGEAGVCVLSTPAKILACDLTLHPGQAATFHYSETSNTSADSHLVITPVVSSPRHGPAHLPGRRRQVQLQADGGRPEAGQQDGVPAQGAHQGAEVGVQDTQAYNLTVFVQRVRHNSDTE